MRINIILLTLTILLGAGLTFWLDGSSNPGSSGAPIVPVVAAEKVSGDPVPAFEFRDINGKIHHINDFKGKVTLINFWATWCAPCVIEFPKLIKLASDHPDIFVIALSSDIHDEKITHFLKKISAVPANFIIARDVKRKITTDVFQTFKLPETLIISTSGTISKKIVGDTEWDGQDIQNLLLSLKK